MMDLYKFRGRFVRKFLFLLFICGFCCFAEAEPLHFSVSAESAILINAETGVVLYEKNAHSQRYPASITKVATALYTLERKRGALEEIATVDDDAISIIQAQQKQASIDKYPAHRLEHDGTHMGLKRGEQMALRDLLYGLMLVSGNDAANVLAQHISGSVPAFMTEMNSFLKSKGIKETSFLNPHGLHHPSHVSSAYDMAKMTQLALRDPIFREIVKTVRYTRPQTNKQVPSYLLQGNRLLKSGAFFYPKAIGVKTGYHSNAGYNLVAAAEKDGRTLIAVLMGGKENVPRFKEAITLFETAFSQAKVTRTLFTKDYDPFSLKMEGATAPISAAVAEDLKIEYFPAEEPSFKAFLQWDSINLPLAKGQKVGSIQLKTLEGQVLKSAPLYALNSVEQTVFSQFLGVCAKLKSGLLKKQTILIGLVLLCSIVISIYRLRKRKTIKES
jgi:D-alanyl-D-alanine carboxypeptidase (penicillin-binding protein 5/6)